MFVTERFVLNKRAQGLLREMVPPFGYDGFGEFIFFRTYSRRICDKCRIPLKYDGSTDYCVNCGANFRQGQEHWADCVIRYINGTFSIRKDWYVKNHIHWDEHFWQDYATRMAISGFNFEWSPPGRGLWAMGSDFVYERGSMALQNCGLTVIGKSISGDISWLMDALMLGVGVGFVPIRDDSLELRMPVGEFDNIIPDSREGWTDSVVMQIESYIHGSPKPRHIYDELRGPNSPIRGFGGVSSGPATLKWFHEKIDEYCQRFKERTDRDSVWLKTCLANAAGCCVVAGNVRRSAELAAGKLSDPTFKDLKRYALYPEREDVGWMSNNSVMLESDEDFQSLGEIARRVIENGEPGYLNLQNFRFGRIGKRKDKVRKDNAISTNPCGEQPLADKEVCTLAETLPTMCPTTDAWLQACEYATFYASTVTLLPTHQPATNKIIAKNRRIGVGIIDFTGWKLDHGVHKVTQWLRDGYKRVRKVNKRANQEAGVPPSIRVTTVKPGGTVPKLPGKTSGIGHPTFKHTLRRVRLPMNSAICDLLNEAGVPHEVDHYSMNTVVYEWPIIQGPAKPADEVSLWEQASNLVLMQREWSDNAVSNTLYFRPKWQLVEEIDDDFERRLGAYIGESAAWRLLKKRHTKDYLIPERYKIQFKYGALTLHKILVREYDPKHEEEDIEPVLSAIAPVTKSVSLLPHSPKGAYRQMPEEGISESEYFARKSQIGSVDWTRLIGSDGVDEKYCTGESCEIPSQR